MWRSLVLGAFVAIGGLLACGLDVMGVGSWPAADGAAAPPSSSSPIAAMDSGTIAEGELPGGDTFDASSAVIDASTLFDAGDTYDAGPLPADAGRPLVYVVSGRFWTFEPVTGAWGGSTQLPFGTCPTLDELAVDAFGRLYAVGNSGSNLYLVDASDPMKPSCTAIGPGLSGYPQALAFAPRGTLSPSNEELVGFLTNGDYVRVDTTTGALDLVKPGALSGYQIGDLASVGSKGYVALTGDSCGTDQCIWAVSLATGEKVGGAPVGLIPASNRITGLAHWGGLLHAFSEDDEAYSFNPTNPAGVLLRPGPPGYINVRYRGAGSRTIAPTN